MFFRSFSAAALLVALFVVPARAQSARPAGIEVAEATIADLRTAMEQGKATSVQLVDAYLARIAAYDVKGPQLNAMIRLNPAARTEAAALDAERREGRIRGPLHGVPIILKDNYDVAGLATSGASLALVSNVPAADAFVVKRLRDAGAIVLGQSNMHELAAGITTISSLGGQTRNPYDPRRCPGGSSGGTGVAVAASFAAVGWGSDTCGSIRIPSAYNNLYGLRPTQGMASRSGVIPLSHTQDVPGPLARTVTDLAIALDATIGADPADTGTRVFASRAVPRFADSLSATALRGARLGVLRPYFTDIDAEIADTVRAAIAAMKAAGAEIIEVDVAGFDSLVAGSSVIAYEFKFDLLDYLAAHPSAKIASLKEILDRGLYHDALKMTFERREAVGSRDSPAYRAAIAKRGVIRDRMIAILDSLRLDALVYPTMRRKPAIVGELQQGTTCALSAQSGLPALSAPAGFSEDGLPIGIELMGRPWADARLVALAYSFERAGSRRRAPSTTPPLANGRAPLPVSFTVAARASALAARGHFSYDQTRNELSYVVRLEGSGQNRVQAVGLVRADGGKAAHVIHRLSGPGVTSAVGTLVLDAIDRRALRDGHLALSVITDDDASGAGNAVLRLPANGR
jgi:Asp-tRNA(Asn)/Glu-tRNA(Gln) amidotransferase A subunit family amidase